MGTLFLDSCKNRLAKREHKTLKDRAALVRRSQAENVGQLTGELVAAGEPARGRLLREEACISKEQTLELIKRFGNDRKTLDAEAEKLKATAGKL